MDFKTPFWQNKTALIDSRKLLFPEQTIFFAIKGKKANGHQFVVDLYQKGVRHFVLSEPLEEEYEDASIYYVDNVLKTLQDWSRFHRQQFEIPVLAITGSNGKTTIKEWLFQLLQPQFNIIKSPKSYNSQLGVPLSVLSMKSNHNLAIFEAGISQVGEMERLEQIIKPTIGIFSNIGKAHAAGFGRQTQKIHEKLRLFEHCQCLVYRYEQEKIHDEIEAKGWTNKTHSWGDTDKATTRVKIEVKENTKTKLTFTYSGFSNFEIIIPFVNKAAIENCIHAIVASLVLGANPAQIKEQIQYLKDVPMRLELKEGINQCHIIDDSYNNDLEGVKIALDFLTQKHKKHSNYVKTVIISDIVETNQYNLYIEIAALLQQHQVQKVIGVGTELLKQKWVFNQIAQTYFYRDTAAFLAALNEENLTFYQETILLKGARQFEFERIAQQLKKRVHGTVLEISLTALENNLYAYKRKLKTATKMMAMVKASAYGSGSVEVAQLLQYHQVDYLGVAYVDEGVALRKRGINIPIVVMNTTTIEFELLCQYQLQPVLYDFKILLAFNNYLESNSIANYAVHVELDTGMGRLGFVPNLIPKLIEALSTLHYIKVESIFAHLAAADEPIHQDYTYRQIELFQSLAGQIKTSLSTNPLLHILNSAGIIHYNEHQMDMVRLGIGLYGVSKEKTLLLQTVARLKTTVLQIKTIAMGQTIGYGREGKVTKNSKIAVLAVGYADGLLRAAGNGRFSVQINGQLAPTIGNICMDMCFVDVTHIPTVKVGDEVIIFDDKVGVHQLAATMNTIAYEVLTNINDRVPRVFYED